MNKWGRLWQLNEIRLINHLIQCLAHNTEHIFILGIILPLTPTFSLKKKKNLSCASFTPHLFPKLIFGTPSQETFPEHPFWTRGSSQVLPQYAVLLPIIELACNMSLSSPNCKLPGGSDRVEFDLESLVPSTLLETEQAFNRCVMNIIKPQFLLNMFQHGFH